MGKKNKSKNKFKQTYRPGLYGPGGKPPGSKEKESKKKESEDSNSSMKIKKKSSSGKGNKYKMSSSLSAAAQKNIRDTEQAAKKLSKFKAPEMKVSEKKYTQTLPDRPSIPKLPTITTPAGSLNSTSVAKPSGQSGSIKSYSAPVSDYKNVYKNLKRKQFQKPVI